MELTKQELKLIHYVFGSLSTNDVRCLLEKSKYDLYSIGETEGMIYCSETSESENLREINLSIFNKTK